jgi:CPA2 family monovalent cation:H+ antiporter-2
MPTEFYTFLLLLTASMAAFIACQHLKSSLASGYILIGMFLGSSGLNLIAQTPFLKALAEVGVLFLLFTVGLELPFHRLRALRHKIFGIGLLQVGVTSLALAGALSLSSLIGASPALPVLALVLAFSSTAIIVQLLSESFELTTHLGRLCLAILLFQDMVAIGLFIYLSMSQPGALSPLWTLVGLGGTLLLGWIVTLLTDKLFSSYRCYEATIPFVLLTLLGMSLLTHSCGLSSELGAFIAGMSMASTHWRHQIHTELHPFRSLFMAIFFMTMGLEVDLSIGFSHFGDIFWILLILFVVKVSAIFLCTAVLRLPWATRMSLASLIFSSSEFLFVIIPSLSLEPTSKQILLLAGVLSMLITPLGFFIVRNWVERHPKADAIKPQIIIAGFGRMGQTLAHILEKNLIAFLVIDHDTGRVAEALSKNYSAIIGEMRDLEFLRRIGIAHATALLITYRTTQVDFIQSLRLKFPNLEVGMLVTDYTQANQFSDVGVHLIVPEAVDAGMQMATMALQFLGFSEKQTARMVRFPKVPAFLGSLKK